MTEITPTSALEQECLTQSENCGYTSTSFIIWLRWLRWFRIFFVTAPVVCGTLATWQIVAESSPIWAAVFALLATVIPPVHRAANLDEGIRDYENLAGEFTNLRDRFRLLARVSSQKPYEEFEADTAPEFERLEKARSRSLAPPEWTFEQAQEKHRAGHYGGDPTTLREDGGKS